ncbi:Rpp20 subunit of nuclear RNase MRP and P-domain-containing protein [Triangularia verruculosa]|uniref:Rpp20 subunit of nuclear RNase MRP and P-domain-containing protein n=1 Tax=Triangularia verruculosa TaxID=2587418 RepID=A0AAN6XBN3_9PEZI|nr:Rpp20 subunit of nuclear RNase MRP and P-domain-containing protein [Triangularia verruculosa]
MASPTTQSPVGAQKPLSNRPENKLPPIPDGSRIRKRPLPVPPHQRTFKSAVSAVNLQNQTTPDIDGYLLPPRANHTQIIKVSSSASHMSLVKRVRKALESARNSQQGTTKGLPLAARIAALGVKNGKPDPTGPISDALDDVVLIATGRAIQKAIEVGASFTRERDLMVVARTRTVQAVDDIERVDEGAEEEDSARLRQVSCVEIGVRWAS